jgi:hypothetical protein
MPFPSAFEMLDGCDLGRAAGLSFTTAVEAAIDWDQDTRDPLDMHSLTANQTRILIPGGMGGTWRFSIFGTWAGNVTGRRLLTLYKNGVATALGQDSRAAVVSSGLGITVVVDTVLVAGDYVEWKGFQDSGGALVFTPTYCRARRLGP